MSDVPLPAAYAVAVELIGLGLDDGDPVEFLTRVDALTEPGLRETLEAVVGIATSLLKAVAPEAERATLQAFAVGIAENGLGDEES